MDGRRQTQPPTVMHHRPYLGSGSATYRHVSADEEKKSAQVAEIERLSADRHMLALAHMALRKELSTTQQKIEKFRERINGTISGSDIEVHVLRNKIAKFAAEIKTGDAVKNELQREQMLVIELLADKRELNARIQQDIEELEKAHVGLKSLSEMHKELQSLREVHQILRTKFEHERAVNLEKIGQMQDMEKNLFGMSGEVETLRDAIRTAENISSRSFSDPPTQPQPLYQPHIHMNGVYVDMYGKPCGSGNS